MRVTLSDGTYGYGEAAPFPEVGTDDRESCLQALAALTPSLLDRDIHDYQALAPHLAEQAGSQPAARCSLKTALLGAYCRATAIPLWQC